jgi:hypothetical protein
MKKEAPENEASYFSHGLREAVFSFAVRWSRLALSGQPNGACVCPLLDQSGRRNWIAQLPMLPES